MTEYVPKIQDTEKGKWYYAVTCPNTGKILPFDEDPSEGAKRFPNPELFVSCHHCQTHHLFDGSEVKSLRATGEE